MASTQPGPGASTPQGTGESLLAGVFESVQHAAEVIDGLLQAGFDQSRIGVLTSDRTAERDFGPPNIRRELGSASPFSPDVSRLAMGLKPIAALGTPGTGLVATGPLAAMLVAVGLASSTGLEHALEKLDITDLDAREAARRVKNGAVLVSAPALDPDGLARAAEVMRGLASMALQLHLDQPLPSTGVMAEPEASAAEQRARYAPVIEFGQQEVTGGGIASRKS